MSDLAAALGAATGRGLTTTPLPTFAATMRVDSDAGPVFCKTLPAAQFPIIAAEADGLRALASCACVRVPAVLGVHRDDELAWLFADWIELREPAGEEHARLGDAIAALHAQRGERFGWRCDNFIGPTPQQNGEDDNWARFFRDRRLRPQLELAAQNGFDADFYPFADRLLARVENMLAGAQITPSLLHGDLWSGNRAVDAAGRPVIFDPAVHYGHSLCDLAMARLFGGFEPAFYRAWEQVHGPLDEDLIDLYQLYHVLNHLNIFGRSYLAQSLRLVRRLVGV